MGAKCQSSSQCLQYQYVKRLNSSNPSALPVKQENLSSYMQSICSPDACTLDSLCIVSPNPFDNQPTNSTPTGCCLGASTTQSCSPIMPGQSNCGIQSLCLPNNNQGVPTGSLSCQVQSKSSTQWIGILITLIGAATSNLGLNLQKFALRKRFEKKVEHDEQEKNFVLRKLAEMKVSLSLLYKKASDGVANNPPKETCVEMNDLNNETVTSRDEITVADESSDTTKQNITPERAGVRQLGKLRTNNNPVNSEARNEQQFQKKLGMSGLLTNPRWVLGFIVFVIGNACNTVALQYAAQSLVAPLGSISLVVNVIIAPFLNNERWSYNDIVGVILIIAGSSLVVAFSGSNQHDYCLALLLLLFKQVPTIIFLSVTVTLLFVIFFTILIVEKNIHIPDTARGNQLINEALSGNLTHIETIPYSEIQKRQSLVVSDNNGLQIQISDNPSSSGVNQRTVILTEKHESEKSPIAVSKPLQYETGEVSIGDLVNQKRRSRFLEENADVQAVALIFDMKPEHNHREEELEFKDKDTISVAPSLKQEIQETCAPKAGKSIIAKYLNEFILVRWIRKLQIIPKLKEPISLDSFWVRVVLPFAYASLGGLMATLTVLFAKATVNLLSESFTGANQFVHFESWLITGVTVVTAVSQIYWINMGLARYDALLQVPVFFVVWTVFDVVGGGVYYNEFASLSPLQIAFFCIGIGVIFSGVAVLATRLKALHEEEKELDRQL